MIFSKYFNSIAVMKYDKAKTDSGTTTGAYILHFPTSLLTLQCIRTLSLDAVLPGH